MTMVEENRESRSLDEHVIHYFGVRYSLLDIHHSQTIFDLNIECRTRNVQ